VKVARGLGFEPSARQMDAFARYAEELARANEAVRLVGSTDLRELYIRHFLDSLTLLPVLPPGPLSMVDVGAGAGFPGLPLKVARPEIELVLLESVGKKAAFLEGVIAALELTGARVTADRAEEAGHEEACRERYDVAASRALAELSVGMELCLPLVRVGGLYVAMKKGDVSGELARAARAFDLLQAQLLEVRDAGVPDLLPGHQLVVIEKRGPTPDRYPRRAGVPAKRPL